MTVKPKSTRQSSKINQKIDPTARLTVTYYMQNSCFSQNLVESEFRDRLQTVTNNHELV